MTVKLNINQIMRYLPHRYPFLLIDAVDELVPGETIRAHKCVTINESIFNGHFPDNPVMPGVIQIEAMGQTGALLALLSGAKLDDEKSIYVTSIDDCRFRRPIIPGDVMDLRAKVVRQRLGMWKLACECLVNGERASEALITATTAPKVKPPELPAHLPAPPTAAPRS
ncbi:MAG: 3-hydroxyacyl-ACP dehydratase FabZ [Deltaproteobacteria bacterium]|nr:3-hydroxyacyl-ACP dehydratase FabZ [Deltaproteobacteria bacterium]